LWSQTHRQSNAGKNILTAHRHIATVIGTLRPTTKTTWWSLSLCKISLESMQYDFDNVDVSIFCVFGLKAPITPRKCGFCDVLNP